MEFANAEVDIKNIDSHSIKLIWGFIEEALQAFSLIFKRNEAFRWLVVTAAARLRGADALGVSSAIRALELYSGNYEAMLMFFRSSSWDIAAIAKAWLRFVISKNLLFEDFGRPAAAIDHTNTEKSSLQAPCVTPLYNSSKKFNFRGIKFGCAGILIGTAASCFCLPLLMLIQGGDKTIRGRLGQDPDESDVSRLAKKACGILQYLGMETYLLADAAFLTIDTLKALFAARPFIIDIITRARSDTAAYYPLPPDNKDRRMKKGAKVKVWDFFRKNKSDFKEGEIVLYGKKKKIKYFAINLVWGKAFCAPIKFVLTIVDGEKIIIATTDLDIDPIKAVQMYCGRFKIETLFRTGKQSQSMGIFKCHFWTKVLKPLWTGATSDMCERRTAECGLDEEPRKKIIDCYNAIQNFAMLNSIAIGITQMCSLLFSNALNPMARWLRAPRPISPSEETVSICLSKTLPIFIKENPGAAIALSINEKRVICKNKKSKKKEQNAQKPPSCYNFG
jgi:hypothetical protein